MGGRGMGRGWRVAAGTMAFACMIALAGCGGDAGRGQEADRGAVLNGMRSTYAQYADSVEINASRRSQIDYMLERNKQGKDVVESVLSDNVITADEMNDVERQAVGCFARYGYKINVDYWLAKGGGIGAGNEKTMPVGDPKVQDIQAECESGTGYNILVNAYYSAYYNPDDIDLDPYRFQCFVEHDLVDESMSYDEFNRLRRESKNPYIGNPQSYGSPVHDVWFSCTSDPLHNISNSPLKKRDNAVQ